MGKKSGTVSHADLAQYRLAPTVVEWPAGADNQTLADCARPRAASFGQQSSINSVHLQQLIAQLSTFFGITAAFLACIGLYGVLSHNITRRTNEFGIRMALGAERRDVLWMVLGEALRLILVGVAIGLVLALACSRVIASSLFGLSTYDPVILVLASVAMTGTALLAAYLPARRATRIDPMTALRYE